MRDLAELNVQLGLDEIKLIAKENFLKIIRAKISERALAYLLNMRGSKGKEIKYERLEMAEYLMPYNKMSIENKQNLFSVRNRMIEIGNNFGKKENCIICKTNEDMSHIYSCKFWNKRENELPFEKIYNGNLNEQVKVFRKFEQNMKTRNDEIEKNKNLPCDPVLCDPLNIIQFSNG